MNKLIYLLKVSLYLSVIKYSASSTNMHTIIVNASCVCVCVCVRVYVVYEDTNLYNDMGMT